MAEKYRWSHPTEWLREKLDGISDPIKLHEFATAMMGKLDGDDIQDLFQSDMDDDGYFTESPEYAAEQFARALTREEVVKILASISIESYGHETDEMLQTALVTNILDGTIDIDTAQETLTVEDDE